MLKDIVLAGRDAGLSSERIRAGIRNSSERDPLCAWRNELSPEFSKRLNARDVSSLIGKLYGTKQPERRLFSLGDAVSRFNSSPEAITPNEADIEVLVWGFKIIERALEQGRIFNLPRQEIGAIIYILTRLAKVEAFNQNGTIPNYATVQQFIGNVDRFRKEFFKLIPQYVAVERKKLDKLEEEREPLRRASYEIYQQIVALKGDGLRPLSTTEQRELNEWQALRQKESRKLLANPSWHKLGEIERQIKEGLAKFEGLKEQRIDLEVAWRDSRQAIEDALGQQRLSYAIYLVKDCIIAADMFRDGPVTFLSTRYREVTGSRNGKKGDVIGDYEMVDETNGDPSLIYHTHYNRAYMPFCALAVEYIKHRNTSSQHY